jgi:hypothetical protein
MAINITSLFQDILESPEQKQQRQMAEGFERSQNAVSQLTGLATAAAPLVGTMAELQGRRTEALQRGVGGLLGRDVRSTSEKLQDALSRFNPQDPRSVSQTTQMLQQMGLGAQGAQLAAMALEEQQKSKLIDLETKGAQQNLEINAAAGRRAETAEGRAAAIEQARIADATARTEARAGLVSAVNSSNLSPQEKTAYSAAANLGSYDEDPSKLLGRLYPEGQSPWLNVGGGSVFNTETETFLSPPKTEDQQLSQDNFTTLIKDFTPESVSNYFGAMEAATTPTAKNEAIRLLERNPSATRTAASEVEVENKAAIAGLFQGQEVINTAASKALAIIDENFGFFTSGVGVSALESLGGLGQLALQPNKDLVAALATLKANVAFGELQEMKASSPMGASGLGAVSNIELQLLGSTLASLETTQNPEQLRQAIVDVQTHYANFLKAEMGVMPEIDFANPAYNGSFADMGNGTFAVKTDPNDDTSWRIMRIDQGPAQPRQQEEQVAQPRRQGTYNLNIPSGGAGAFKIN